MMNTTAPLHQISNNSNNTSWGGLDLSDTPELEPIIRRQKKNDNNNNNNVTKYVGVSYMSGNLNNRIKKWRAQITINKKIYTLGLYETEEEAGRVYAKALYKYKPNNNKERPGGKIPVVSALTTSTKEEEEEEEEEKSVLFPNGFDFDNIPDQPLILKDKRKYCSSNTDSSSIIKYKGVNRTTYDKNKFQSRININSTRITLGTYNTQEEAAAIYAKADYYIKLQQQEKQQKQQKQQQKQQKQQHHNDNHQQEQKSSDKKENVSNTSTVDTDDDNDDDSNNKDNMYSSTNDNIFHGVDFSKIPDQPLIMKKRKFRKSLTTTTTTNDNDNNNKEYIIKYEGVGIHHRYGNKRFRVRIRYNKRQITLGYFITQEEAATIYAKAMYYVKLLQQQRKQKKQQQQCNVDNTIKMQINNVNSNQRQRQKQRRKQQQKKKNSCNYNNDNEKDNNILCGKIDDSNENDFYSENTTNNSENHDYNIDNKKKNNYSSRKTSDDDDDVVVHSQQQQQQQQIVVPCDNNNKSKLLLLPEIIEYKIEGMEYATI